MSALSLNNSAVHFFSLGAAMSSHFKTATADRRMSKWELFKRLVIWKPQTREEIQFARHSYFRITVGLCGLLYFAYWHPEYSFVSAWYHGTAEPIAHRGHHFDPAAAAQRQQIEDGIRSFFGMRPRVISKMGLPGDAEPSGDVRRDKSANSIDTVTKS
jgi:hypothetical protein